MLFQVQPLLGRFLLPWFGGSPEVWTSCMLFFQLFLLAGYAYAHLLIKLKNIKLQAILHVGLLAAALLFLPIFPSESLKPKGNDNPVIQILLICSLTVGLPYLLLSATSPLVQVWFTRTFPGRSPYRLYAISNAGSLLALGTFPFLFEPYFTRIQMVCLWSLGFVIFTIFCVINQFRFRSCPNSILPEPSNERSNTASASSRIPKWLWIAFPAVGSMELLAVTNKITQDIAVVPFLWILPLGLYLLSFIICFEHPRWYRRRLFVSLFILGIVGVIIARRSEIEMGAYQVIGIYNFMLFTCCMVCHGELYHLRPDPKHLTSYYLMISAGGALGGLYVAVICPLIFDFYIELYQGLLFAACFLLLVDRDISAAQRKRRPYWIASLAVFGLLGISLMGQINTENQQAIDNKRNFFGVLTIWEEAADDPENHKLLMQHGTTFHGLQFQSAEKKHIPTAYYSPNSAIGLVIKHFPKNDRRRIGVVGLGVGTIASYGKKNDFIRFYEINPEVVGLAHRHFTYLHDSQADVKVVLGDARLTMEREDPQIYDVLVLDAFSSDAVPLHLLTVEAMEIYLKHLAEDGVLAFHISSMHLDLHSVVWKLADHLDLKKAWIESYEQEDEGALASDWILLARNESLFELPEIAQTTRPIRMERKDMSLWTDDHINVLQIIKKSPLDR